MCKIGSGVDYEIKLFIQEMGVPLDGLVLMLKDNNSVVLNTMLPTSMLKKEHDACTYQCVGEGIAAGIVKFTYIPSEENFADILIKSLLSEEFHALVKSLLFHVP